MTNRIHYWKSGIFSRPKLTPGYVKREVEEKIVGLFLESDKTTLHIVGPDGLGKTYLLGWIASKFGKKKNIAYIDCNSENLNIEGLIESIGKETKNKFINDYLTLNQDTLPVGNSNLLNNCISHCIEEIDNTDTIIIIDDYHKQENEQIKNFFSNILCRLTSGKLILTSNQESKLWGVNELYSFQDKIQLIGYKKREIKRFLLKRGIEIEENELDKIQARTGGIPKILELFVRQYHTSEMIRSELNNIYNDNKEIGERLEEWIDNQLKKINKNSLNLLALGCLLQQVEPEDFWFKLYDNQTKEFEILINELITQSIIYRDDSGLTIFKPIRDYLLKKLSQNTKRGMLYQKISNIYYRESLNKPEHLKIKLLVEAIWYSGASGDFQKVVKFAEELLSTIEIRNNISAINRIIKIIILASSKTNNYDLYIQWANIYIDLLYLRGDIELSIKYAILVIDKLKKNDYSIIEQIDCHIKLYELYHAEGNYKTAKQHLESCILLINSNKKPDDYLEKKLSILPNLASINVRIGNSGDNDKNIIEAQNLLEDVIAIAKDREEMEIYLGLAKLKLSRLHLKYFRNSDKSLNLLSDAEIIFTRHSYLSSLSEVYGLMGDYYRYQKTPKDNLLAIEYYQKGSEIAKKLGRKDLEAINYGQMAFLLRNMNNLKKALEYSEFSLLLNKKLGNRVGEQMHNVLQGEIYIDLNLYVNALKFIKKGLQISRNSEYPQPIGEATAYRAFAKYYLSQKDFNLAKKYLESSINLYESQHTYQYIYEALDFARPIYSGWTNGVSLDILFREFDETIISKIIKFNKDKALIIASCIYNKLYEIDDLSEYTEETSFFIQGLCEIINVKSEDPDLLNKWLDFCKTNWPYLDVNIYKILINECPKNEKQELYKVWLSALLKSNVDNREDQVRKVIKLIINEVFNLEDKFFTLEALEFETLFHNDVGDYFTTSLTELVTLCYHKSSPLPEFSVDILRFLEDCYPHGHHELIHYINERQNYGLTNKILPDNFTFLPSDVDYCQTEIIQGSKYISEKRRVLRQELMRANFLYIGGTNHEKWKNLEFQLTSILPRHPTISPGVTKNIRDCIQKTRLLVSDNL